MAYVSKFNDEELTDLDLSKTIMEAPAEQSSVAVTNVVALPVPKTKTAQVRSFDYAGLSAAVAKDAEAAAKRIRARLKAHTLETGKELLAIKKVLGHGKFGKWLEFHFGWQERTAQNYMNSATAFGSTPQVIDALPPTTVYKLAAKSTPDSLRQSVIDEVQRGEKPDPKLIEKKIAATKSEARKNGPREESTSANASHEPSESSVTENATASPGQALATETSLAVTLGKDSAQSAPTEHVQELLAQKIVGHLKKRFGDKFSHLRDAILKTDPVALRKALSDA